MSGVRIDRKYFLDEIIEKLVLKHSVEPYEVEETIMDGENTRFFRSKKGHRPGEDV